MAGNAETLGLESVLDCLTRSGAFDPRVYKRSSLTRRVHRRMQTVGIPEYDRYRDYLERHPEEHRALLNIILINVSEFFRDPPAWASLREAGIPRLVALRPKDAVIRVWSAGCAAGQEPYTIAMAMAEELGISQTLRRLKVFATDADEDVLARARQALYSELELSGVPPALRSRYFSRQSEAYEFHPEIRRTIIFGRHDLAQDHPLGRIDLLVCRNTLMYFQAETQARILARFHFALNDGGVLFLGKAESLHGQDWRFHPLDPSRRLFTSLRGSEAQRSAHDKNG